MKNLLIWKKWIAYILVICFLCPVSSVYAKEEDNLDTNQITQVVAAQGYGVDYFEGIEISEEEAASFPRYEENRIKSKAISLHSYGSTYAYNLLITEAEKEAYRRLVEACEAFEAAGENATETQYSSGTKGYIAFAVSVRDLDLPKDDAAGVVISVIYDNPQFFWTKGYSYSYRSSTNTIVDLCLACADDYSNGEERTALKEKMQPVIEGYLDLVVGLETDYEKELTLHNALAENLEYAYDNNRQPQEERWAHTIVGAFDGMYNSVVCEGYAKAFQLLLNACGIENIYIVGSAKTGGSWSGHAWNQVKIGDAWYNVDLTWNDQTYGYRHTYFNVTDSEFSSTHIPYGQEQPIVGLWCYPVKECTEQTYSYQNQGPIIEKHSYLIQYDKPEKGTLMVLNKGVEVLNGVFVNQGCVLDVYYRFESDDYNIVLEYWKGSGEEKELSYRIEEENQSGEVQVPVIVEDNDITICVTIKDTVEPQPSQTPEITMEPVETEQPSQTPEITKEPSETEQPSQTPEITKEPLETEQPSQTPEITKEPVKTEQPSQTPEITKEPVETEQPSQTPEITKEPVETEQPSQTPEITKEPVETEQPSQTPEITKEPMETEQPSQAPIATEKPIPTRIPDETYSADVNKLSNKVRMNNLNVYVGKKKRMSIVKPYQFTIVDEIKDYQFGRKVNGKYLMQVTYRSLNTKIATINKRTGVITGKKIGSTKIIASILYSNGEIKSYSANVIIKKPYLKLSYKKLTIKQNQFKKLTVKKYGVNGTVRWYSKNSKIAFVNKKTGKIKGRKIGSTYIYARVGTYQVKCVVRIKL